MSLPRLLVLTDRTQAGRPLVDVVATAVDAGARAVVLREKDLTDAERRAIAGELRALLAPVGGLLVVGGAAGFERDDAVHLAARDAVPVPRPPLLGRSCHSAAEVARARAERCDWVLLSPVFPTASKPGYGPALGTGGLAALLTGGPPGYALGGVQPDDVAGCRAAGAHGVAVMGPLMRDPARTTDYLAALAGAERAAD